jgi:hypothetical protein
LRYRLDHDNKTWVDSCKDFLKNHAWGAPSALSALIAILSLFTAIFSYSAAKDSAVAARQSLRLQHILEKRALEDQRARVEFIGGRISYIGIRDNSGRELKHIYSVELKLRNYGVRPALATQVAFDIEYERYSSEPRTVPGGAEIPIFFELVAAKPIESFDNRAKLGTVFYDEWPVPSLENNNGNEKINVCGPVEIRSISVLRSESFQSSVAKFVLNPEASFQYDAKSLSQSQGFEIPFHLSQILNNATKHANCRAT